MYYIFSFKHNQTSTHHHCLSKFLTKKPIEEVIEKADRLGEEQS